MRVAEWSGTVTMVWEVWGSIEMVIFPLIRLSPRVLKLV